MRAWFESLKPAAPARLHLLTAACVWTGVGAALALFGVRWALAGQWPLAPAILVGAVVLGALKAEFVLARSARRAIARIQARGDGRCIGGFLTPLGWLFVLGMMTLGYVLRHGLAPRPIVGVIYVAVGAALVLGSRRFWAAWRAHP